MVSPDEFLRRFLLHVLPKGLVRIRHLASSPTVNGPHRCGVAASC